MDSKCARPASRIACASFCAIAPMSPVANATAMPEVLPESLPRICSDRSARHAARTSPPEPESSTSTGASTLPDAERPANHADRAKSYPPGSNGGAGGVNLARKRISAPSVTDLCRLFVAGVSSPAIPIRYGKFTRTLMARPVPGSRMATTNLRCRTAGWSSTASTRPVKIPETGRPIGAAPTNSDRAQMVRQPNVKATVIDRIASRKSGKLARPCRQTLTAIAIDAQIAQNAIHQGRPGIANHPAIPAPKPTASHGPRSKVQFERKHSTPAKLLDMWLWLIHGRCCNAAAPARAGTAGSSAMAA